MADRAMPAARATHAPHRAVLRRLGLSVGITIAFVATFGVGAWAEDQRMRGHYIREGQVAATYNAIFDGYWLYLDCLSDDCSSEKASSDFIVARGEERLRNNGEWVPWNASAIPSRRADDAEGGSAGTEGSAVAKPDAQTQAHSTPHGDS